MTNRKTSTRLMTVCAAAALTAVIGMSYFLPRSARAQERPAETAGIGWLSGIEDGYDAGVSGICCEIEAPAF